MEIIEPVIDETGSEIPISERFTAEFVGTLVDVTDVNPRPQCWCTATLTNKNWVFSPPVNG